MTNGGRPRRAWITGAGKGIGRAVARRLAAEGWSVAVSARTEHDLVSLRDECSPGQIHPFPLDTTDEAGTEAVLDAIEQRLGPLDLVILNAGTHAPTPLRDFTPEKVRALLETNVMGTVNGLSAAMTRFVARRSGHVAVVASLAGYRGLPGAAGYGASKAALINLCEALKPELERHGVRLTLVNPGFVKTPLTDRNDFPMPFLVSAEDAADVIVRGLARSRFEIAFPWRFAALMKVLRMVPSRLLFAVTRRMVRA